MLIAEDERNEYELVLFLLDKFHLSSSFHIFHATNGKQAVQILEDAPIDVLLTDIEMPFVNGLDLAKKARESHEELPIIFFSCYDNFSYAKTALSLGACNYMLKPLDPGEFEKTIASTITRLEQMHRKQNLLVEDTQDTAPESDTARHAVQLVQRYIHAHYNEDVSLNALADLVYLNTSYLSTIFKNETGCGINKYLKNLRLEKANDLLQKTNMKISDITTAVGFHNDSYFIKSFHEHFGMTPEKMRNKEH